MIDLKLYDRIQERYGFEFTREFVNQWGRYLYDRIYLERNVNGERRYSEVKGLHLTLKNLQKKDRIYNGSQSDAEYIPKNPSSNKK